MQGTARTEAVRWGQAGCFEKRRLVGLGCGEQMKWREVMRQRLATEGPWMVGLA